MTEAFIKLSDLKPHPRNPKHHDLGSIITSIESQGAFMSSVFVDKRTGYILAGHGRLKALIEMQRLGKQPPRHIEVDEQGNWLAPVEYRETKDDAHAEAYLIADNRLTELGGWDDEELIKLLQDIAAVDEDLLNATGYDGDDLDMMLNEFDPSFLPPDDIHESEHNQKCPNCGHEFVVK